MINSSSNQSTLSPNAPAFVPNGSKPKVKKTKEERAGPRRRRKKKKKVQIEDDDSDSDFNLDTSDLLEQKSQGSNASSSNHRSRSRSSWIPRTADPSNNNHHHHNSIMDSPPSSDWLGGLLGWNQDIQFNVVDGLFTPPRRRTASRDAESSDAWLDLQAEWLFSKQHMIDVEYALEEAERKKWSEWAVHAAEIERRRRIQIMDEMDKAELRERQRRQQWAISAIEKERNERISTQFLTNLTATNWFNETISSYNLQNYDVVCPYYKLGCRIVCKKMEIQRHMKTCQFALEVKDHSEKIISTDYEVVCPNCVLGCTFIGRRKKLHEHLADSCLYRGKSRQEENDERELLKEIVISECEEERVRRVNDFETEEGSSPGTSYEQQFLSNLASIPESPFDTKTIEKQERRLSLRKDGSKDEKAGRKALLQKFMETQMHSVVTSLHHEILKYWYHWKEVQAKRRSAEETIIDSLRRCVTTIWPFARLEVFGSWASGLPSTGSDIDLVVCFSDECQTLPSITGVIPLLQGLANFLEKDACEFLTIKKVLLHTRVPLIKAEAKIYVNQTTGQTFAEETEGAECIEISLDISIDGPEHSGLATTAVTETMLRELPGIGPVATLLKEYLKTKGLCDAFTGGLPSYGVVLLVLLLFLRRHQASRILRSHSSSPVTTVPAAVTSTAVVAALSAAEEDISSDTIRETKLETISESLIHDSASAPGDIPLTPASPPTTRPTRRLSEGHIRRFVKSGVPGSYAREDSCYHWSLVEAQREFGRRVAAKLLGSDSPTSKHVGSPVRVQSPIAETPQDVHPAEEYELNLPVDQLKSPILGVIVIEFLGFYGDGFECGRHGFSVRDGGFRFDMHASGVPIHPQAAHPLVIEDPVNVMNNVAKNSYNAAAVQRAFLDADEKFKNVVTRYSGRVGSALAYSSRSSGGSVLKEMFGLCLDIPPVSVSDTALMDNVNQERHSSIESEDKSEGLLFSLSEDESAENMKLKASRIDSGSEFGQPLESPRVRGDAEYKKALHDMLLLQFRRFPGGGLSDHKAKKSNRRYSL